MLQKKFHTAHCSSSSCMAASVLGQTRGRCWQWVLPSTPIGPTSYTQVHRPPSMGDTYGYRTPGHLVHSGVHCYRSLRPPLYSDMLTCAVCFFGCSVRRLCAAPPCQRWCAHRIRAANGRPLLHLPCHPPSWMLPHCGNTGKRLESRGPRPGKM